MPAPNPVPRRALLRRLCGAFAAAALAPACAAQSLYTQSIQTALARTASNLELLLLDLRSREILANTFAAAPIPVGSLLKPFLAIAYAQSHPAPTPTVVCRGHADRCWKPEGHGAMALPEAIAQSCNAYFLALAYGLATASIPYLPPPPNTAPETLIGLDPAWRIAPDRLAAAYAQLLAAPATRAHADVLAGMRGSATRGTAARIGPHPGGVLAKTGTASCVDQLQPQPCMASGDGLVIAAVPAALPALLLLVRKRATTGAMTAEAAGPILRQLEALHAE